jgi:hypothetical protein
VYPVIVFLSMILPMPLLSSKLKRNLIAALNLTARTTLIAAGSRTVNSPVAAYEKQC